MKRLIPLYSAGGAILGYMLAFAAFGRLTLALALAAIAGAVLGALALFAVSRIRARQDTERQ
jgi:hypothetical protein